MSFFAEITIQKQHFAPHGRFNPIWLYDADNLLGIFPYAVVLTTRVVHVTADLYA